MGYNTTINILNDGLDQLLRYPAEFVEGIRHAMHRGGTFGVGNHGNVVQVMKTRHADDFRLYSARGNLMIELSPYSHETGELAERHPEMIRAEIEQARYYLNRLEDALPDIEDTA